MKKFTLASAKSFIKKNRSDLTILVKSKFDGMYDCVMDMESKKFQPIVNTQSSHENNLGIQGVWFTHSGNSFYPLQKEDGTVVGFECYNCCGNFILKLKGN